MNAPGLAKNVLAVGSTSSGTTRLTTTDEDRREASANLGDGTIDTISAFSSYGPTQDGRIKPEVLAPGDQVMCLHFQQPFYIICRLRNQIAYVRCKVRLTNVRLLALLLPLSLARPFLADILKIYSAGGGDDDYSCRLVARDGTSMATAVASGAAALVRHLVVAFCWHLQAVYSPACVSQSGSYITVGVENILLVCVTLPCEPFRCRSHCVVFISWSPKLYFLPCVISSIPSGEAIL